MPTADTLQARLEFRDQVKRPHLIAVALIAASLFGAGAASASRLPRLHGGMIAPARALHTEVRAAHARHHRAHHRHARSVVHASMSRASAIPARPAAPVAPRRPARSHAAIPHVSAKPHRATERGGTPYPIGQASLSLGLETRGSKTATIARASATDPTQGVLRGRSPPRGDPSSDSVPTLECRVLRTRVPAAAPATAATFAAVITPAATPIQSDVPRTPAPLTIAALPPAAPLSHRDARASRACVRAFITPADRAPEGGPDGFVMPSWRYFT